MRVCFQFLWDHCSLSLGISLTLLFLLCRKYFHLPFPSSTSPPDIFLLGTAKSGTTALYHRLIQHPMICNRPTKELHFFDTSTESTLHHSTYAKLFESCPPHLLTIDATPSYFRDNVSFKNIQNFYTISELSQKKYIIILRDPVEREISWFYHMKRKCIKFHSTKQAPSPRYQCLLNKSEEASYHFEEYLFSDRFQPWGSMYLHQLKRWLMILPRQQIFIVEMTSLLTCTSLALKRIFAFLNLPTLEPPSTFEKSKLTYQSSYHRNISAKATIYLQCLYRNEMINLLIYLKESKTQYELEFQGFGLANCLNDSIHTLLRASYNQVRLSKS